jgi:hypothetical protein
VLELDSDESLTQRQKDLRSSEHDFSALDPTLLLSLVYCLLSLSLFAVLFCSAQCYPQRRWLLLPAAGRTDPSCRPAQPFLRGCLQLLLPDYCGRGRQTLPPSRRRSCQAVLSGCQNGSSSSSFLAAAATAASIILLARFMVAGAAASSWPFVRPSVCLSVSHSQSARAPYTRRTEEEEALSSVCESERERRSDTA